MEDNQIAQELTYLKSATGQKLVEFPLKDLTILVKRNFRDEKDMKIYEEKYPKMLELVKSIKTEGYHLGQPILVHKNSIAMHGNTNNEVLKGHRRSFAAGYAGLLTVPAIVISGLTEEQKLKIIAEKPPEAIGKIGEFKAVQALKGKMGDQKMADLIGIKKNAVQEWRYLDALPTPLQEMWYSYVRGGKTAFPVGRPAITSLYFAMLRDHKGTTLDALGVESPPVPERIDLNPLGGPEYKKTFDKLVTDGIPASSTVSKKTLKDTAEGIKDDVIRNLVYGLADQPGVDRGKAIDTALDLTGRMRTLQRLEVKDPHLAMLLHFPGSDDPALDRARQNELIKLIEDALEMFVGLHPERSPLAGWEKDDAQKPKFEQLPSAYEGALPPTDVPPIDVEVTPDPNMINIISETGAVTSVRDDSSEVSEEPVATVSEKKPSVSKSKSKSKTRS
jgi:hypothetical protein